MDVITAKKRKSKRDRQYWKLYLFLLPAIAYVATWSYGPMYGIIIAFQDYKIKKGYWGSEWVGLKHFIRFVTYPDFWEMMKNTLRITLYSLALFPIAIIFALLLNELKNEKFKKVVQMITYMPHFLSTVVLCSLVVIFVGREGLIGQFYGWIKGTEGENLLSIGKFFPDIYVWSATWAGLGWSSIIYVSALSSISPELIEAARIDGAGRLQVIRHVNIPGILPTISLSFIMAAGGLLSVGFEKIYLLQSPLNLDYSNVVATYSYNIGIVSGQYSYSTAIGLFQNVVNILIMLLVNKITKKLSGTGMF